MDKYLEAIVLDVLNAREGDERAERVLTILKSNGIRTEDDLPYLSFDGFRGVLSEDEFKTLSNPIFRMTIEQVLEKILLQPGADPKSLKDVVRVFKDNGVMSSSDLKYFDWENLEDLLLLTPIEVEKVMRFVRINFPEEYKEHKAKKNKEDALKREKELLDLQIKREKEIQEMRMNFTKKSYSSSSAAEIPRRNVNVNENSNEESKVLEVLLIVINLVCVLINLAAQAFLLLIRIFSRICPSAPLLPKRVFDIFSMIRPSVPLLLRRVVDIFFRLFIRRDIDIRNHIVDTKMPSFG